MTIFIF